MILFYVSSHGFGHITRCAAIIEELLKVYPGQIGLVCGQAQNDFAREYFEDFHGRIVFRDMVTDIGLINLEKSLAVDLPLLESKLKAFLGDLDRFVAREIEFWEVYDVSMVVTDISIIGIEVGEGLDVPVVGVSNFTWYNQYQGLGLDLDVQERFLESYRKMDHYLVYDYSLDHSYLTCTKEKVGVLSRGLDREKVGQLLHDHQADIYISCGRSASLPKIHVHSSQGKIYHTSGIRIESQSDVFRVGNVPDSHNYIAASKLALIKAGWGSVAECLVAGVPMVVIERPGVVEDTLIIKQLKDNNRCLTIKESELKSIDVSALMDRALGLDAQPYCNNASMVAKKLLGASQSIGDMVF